jgi:hypothetical protein
MLALPGCQRTSDTPQQSAADTNAADITSDESDTDLRGALGGGDRGSENPVVRRGKPEPEGQIGSFTQNRSFDCFFLTSVIALANDPDGLAIIESGISSRWR